MFPLARKALFSLPIFKTQHHQQQNENRPFPIAAIEPGVSWLRSSVNANISNIHMPTDSKGTMKTYFPLPTLQTHKTIGQNGLRATLNKYILKYLLILFHGIR